ncbi:unnamed protein product [Chrysoparadoxa australica]
MLDTMPYSTTFELLQSGVYYALAITVLRLGARALVFKPLAYRAMHLSPLEQPSTVVKALDRAARKRHLPSRDTVEELADGCGMSYTEASEYLALRRREKLQNARLKKYQEAVFRFVTYVVLFGLGLYVNWGRPWLVEPNVHMWKGWPHLVDPLVKIHYHASVGLYLHLLVFQFLDVKRSDFWEMFIHHLVTIGLLWYSWILCFTRIGTVVIIIHDVADVPLELAKVCNYTSVHRTFGRCAKVTADVVFAIFAVTFLTSRLYIFPKLVWLNILCNAYGHGLPGNGLWLQVILLLTLQVLHVFWSALILRMVVKFAKEDLKDIRSESEDEEDKALMNGAAVDAALKNGDAERITNGKHD